jgi:hypothetical protein
MLYCCSAIASDGTKTGISRLAWVAVEYCEELPGPRLRGCTHAASDMLHRIDPSP